MSARGPSVSPDGVALPQLPNYHLLSSAIEIVTRQRLAEQLDALLLNSTLAESYLDESDPSSNHQGFI